ncbi:MAG TPA: patatin-like phospholipase family protein [Thermoanaerobaculia bacterium]|nr:patatin-like phospholipase family protein [Thermoanaerobaculia bacterium]
MAGERPERNVLALDGGGVRGVVTLHLIDSLEKRLGRPACEFFDMFAGTSTGAIIAALLAFRRMTAAEILDLYRKLIPRVFRPGWRKLFRLFVPRIYSTDFVLGQLEEFFADRKLGDLAALRPSSPQAILLTTHDLVRNEEIFLSNYPFETGKVNFGPTWMVRDAVAASAFSAPWYFGPYQGRFIDGGVSIFNTPARQAAIEALDYCASPEFESGKTVVWSFGSGAFSSEFQKWSADDYFPWQWAGRLYSDIQSDAEADQIFGAIRMARHREIRFRRYQATIASETVSSLRVPVPTPDLPIELDRADALDFLDDFGRRFAATVDWDKPEGVILRPALNDPLADPDLWRSSESPPSSPEGSASARLS